MAGRTVIIRGGTLVTAYGLEEADVWIEDGIIRQIGKETLPIRRTGSGRLTNIFDASGYYVLPGLISLAQLEPYELRHPAAYQRNIRRLIQRGVTSVLHTQRLESWMGPNQVRYRLTPHYNSSLDYGIRIGLDASLFTGTHVRMLRELGFRLFEVTLHRLPDLLQIDWDPLYQLAADGKLAFHLHIPQTAPLTRAERSDVTQLWTSDCLYGRIRTCIAAKGVPPEPRQSAELFYRVVQLEHSQLPAILGQLVRSWYSFLPVFCPIDQWRGRLQPSVPDPERLLQLLVRLASTNVAKAIGWYPRKGCLLPGADADLWLLKKAEWLTNFALSTMLNMSEVCLPDYVMSKGRWIYRQGTYFDLVGSGCYLSDMRPYNYVI